MIHSEELLLVEQSKSAECSAWRHQHWGKLNTSYAAVNTNHANVYSFV